MLRPLLLYAAEGDAGSASFCAPGDVVCLWLAQHAPLAYARIFRLAPLVPLQMKRAFPDVSWVFLFRNPVEVMVSNLKVGYLGVGGRGGSIALFGGYNCVRVGGCIGSARTGIL